MRLSTVVEPTVEPCTLAELKWACRVDLDIAAENDLITKFGVAARKKCEQITRRCFVSTQLRLSMDCFPTQGLNLWTGYNHWDRTIRLPRSSVIAVQSITYVDTTGTTVTLASDQYIVSVGNAGRIVPAYNCNWPTCRIQPDSVNILFTVGFGTTAASVPEDVKQGIRFLTNHYYINRSAVEVGATGAEIPLTVEDILSDACWGGSL